MNLSVSEIGLVVAELQARVCGAVVQKVQQPRPTMLLLSLRGAGESHRLLVEIAAARGRLHLTARPFENPLSPPAFCRKLRKELLGARVNAVSQVAGDRVVSLVFDRGRDGESFQLLVELSSHHANLFLLGGDGRIISAMRHSRSHRRCLLIGEPYLPPPLGGGDPGQSRFAAAGVSDAIDSVYHAFEDQQRQERAHESLARALRQATKKQERAVRHVEADLKRAEEAEAFRRKGDLLKSNFHQLRRGMASVTVTDYHQPEMPLTVVPLDPSLSPQENLAHCFKQYRRYKGAAARIEARLGELRAKLAQLNALNDALEAVGDGESLQRLLERATGQGIVQRKSELSSGPRKAETPTREIARRFTSVDGVPILVGKGARENQQLTFQLARGWDWWLHARDWSGSHVVVRSARSADLPAETLLDAATLAAHYSKGKADTVIDVHYCRAKQVRRVPNAPPGRVYVAQSKSIAVKIDPTRLRRLMSEDT